MENTTELQRFNEYITHNYNRMLTHLRDTCFFQTFQWSLDYYHDAILTIYRAIQNGSLINYNKVDQLLFVAYKNVAINSDNRDRIVIPSDMSEYEHQLLYEEPEDFMEKERLYDEIVESVNEHFDKKHIEVFKRYLAGEKLYEYDADDRIERRMMEDIKWYLRIQYGTRVQNDGDVKVKGKVSPVIQYDLHHRIVKKWGSIKEISEKLGLTKTAIYKAINNKTPRYGFYWRYGRRRNNKIQ